MCQPTKRKGKTTPALIVAAWEIPCQIQVSGNAIYLYKTYCNGREGRGDYNEITMRVGEITSNWHGLVIFNW